MRSFSSMSNLELWHAGQDISDEQFPELRTEIEARGYDAVSFLTRPLEELI